MKNRPERVTMSAVARQAGVSQMTVSLALRDDPQIPASTRDQIKQVAGELGYRPDPLISQYMSRLRTSRVAETEPIAWLTTHPTAEGWRDNSASVSFFEGALARALKLGYRLDEFWLHAPQMTGRRMSEILLARGIRGVLVAPMHRPGEIKDLQWARFAGAACGSYSLREPELHRACTHHGHAVNVAWEALTNLGYRRIGLVMADHHNRRTGGQWLASLLLQHYLIPAWQRVTPLITPDDGWKQSAVLQWFDEQRPDAVLSFGTVRTWLQDRAGPDGAPPCGFALVDRLRTDWASVDEHRADVGAAALDLVVEQLNAHQFGLPEKPKTVLIECSWRDGPTAPRVEPAPRSAGFQPAV